MGTEDVRARQVLLDMQDLLSRDPYEALGLIPSATPSDIRNAFLSKSKQFHPHRFGRMPPEIQRLANEVFLALRAVHDTLARPTVVKSSGPTRTTSGALPTLAQRPGGTGAAPAVRPSPLPQQISRPATGQTPTTQPAPATPAAARPAWPATTPATRPGTMPTPIRPPTQPLRTIDPPAGQSSARGTPSPDTKRPPQAPAGRPTSPATARPAAAVPVEPELVPIYELFALEQLAAARVALDTLVARNPKSTRYRSLLSFAKGREAQLAGRVDEARVELHEALQVDPDLQVAKSALGELFSSRRR